MNSLTSSRETYIEQLQSIHGLKDALELSNDQYRELLYRLTGSQSARYMTVNQRQRVITFMLVHKALDEAIIRAEEARDTLNQSYEVTPGDLMEKVISLDGKHEASMYSSIEDIIHTMRHLHGPDVKLTGISEKRIGSKTVLAIAFARPAVFLLAS